MIRASIDGTGTPLFSLHDHVWGKEIAENQPHSSSQSKGCDFTKLATSRFCSKTWPTGLRLNMINCETSFHCAGSRDAVKNTSARATFARMCRLSSLAFCGRAAIHRGKHVQLWRYSTCGRSSSHTGENTRTHTHIYIHHYTSIE